MRLILVPGGGTVFIATGIPELRTEKSSCPATDKSFRGAAAGTSTARHSYDPGDHETLTMLEEHGKKGIWGGHGGKCIAGAGIMEQLRHSIKLFSSVPSKKRCTGQNGGLFKY